MPIPVGGVVTTPGTPGTPGTPVPPPPSRPPGTGKLVPAPRSQSFTVQLRASDGETLGFTVGDAHSGPFLMPGAQGLGLPESEFFSEPLPDAQGSVYLGARFKESRVFLPVFIGARTYSQLSAHRQQLMNMLDPRRGPVSIGVRDPNGELWERSGWYTDGLTGDESADAAGWSWEKRGLEFQCPDPFWYGDPRSRSWAVNAAKARPLLSASSVFFPVVLGDSLVAGEQSLVVTGDEPTWPTITVSGPGNGLVVRHLDTGQQVSVTGTLLAGQSVTIQGSPMDVFDEAGSDAWDRIPIGEYPFQLLPGRNRVKVDLAAATSASVVTVSWRPARRTGH